MWGHEWQGHVVTCHCDNHAMVVVLASRTSCIIRTLVPNELNSMGTYIIWTCKRCMSLLAVLTIRNHMEWRELIKVHVSHTFIIAYRTYSSTKIKKKLEFMPLVAQCSPVRQKSKEWFCKENVPLLAQFSFNPIKADNSFLPLEDGVY